MNRQSLPINEIIVKDRQRLDYGDLEDLASSLHAHGLIQPIVINQEKRLIAGGRRLAAAQKLQWERIDVVYRETLSTEELHILELEENIRRLEESWQERCLHIAQIHRLKESSAAVDGDSWSQKATGEMLGISDCHVNFNLQMARLLRAELDENNKPLPGATYWPLPTFADAWKLRLRNMANALHAENVALVRQQEQTLAAYGETSNDFLPDLSSVPVEDIDLTPSNTNGDAYLEAKVRYESNPLNTTPFEDYWKEKQVTDLARREHTNTIHLSHRLIKGDSIAYMLQPENAGRFDHVITDIPYGIDVSYLNQQHPRGGMEDVDEIEELHDQDYNKQLIADFFFAAFQCTNDKAFVITWADQMLWQYMYDCATRAGFAVQRWPITWHKTHACMNQCAQYNFTKNTEIAIVCRKPGAMLREHQPGCVVAASRDDLCDQINHPFAKPFLIWQFLADAVSLEGQLILEPFAGRGSGVISMLRMRRQVIGVELDDTHYNYLYDNVKELYYRQLNPDFVFK